MRLTQENPIKGTILKWMMTIKSGVLAFQNCKSVLGRP